MPSPRRRRASVALRRSGPPILALSAIAVSQPLLDLFGRNPEFFVAQDLSASEVILFAVVLALGLPAALITAVAAVATVSERIAALAHHLLMAGLAGLFGLVLLGRNQTSVLIGGALAIGVGLAVAVLEDRQDWLRTVLRYLSPLPMVVLALFLFASDTARLVWSPEAAAAPAEVVAAPAPVSLLVFDELPISSLMTEDGAINAERFPNFARLADTGTWYRNATSPLPRTEAAVPAILSGTVAPGRIPSTIDYPRNLFTLLADSHTINAQEEVTALCPTYACSASMAEGSWVSRTLGSLSDAAVVYGHRMLPAEVRDQLPPVNQSWGDFGESSEAEAADPFAARRDDPAATQTQVGKLAYFDRMIEAIGTDGPGLNVAHGVFPHAPWTLTPQGNAYGAVTEGLEFEPRLVWTDDTELVHQGQIQHLLQLGAADAALGRLIERLEETGQWDESLVAVVADHGAGFEPGGSHREPTADNLDEIFRVPMMLKLPGQQTAVVDDEPAQTVDLVPTIVDALGVETRWEFDGVSLLDGDRSERRPTAIMRDGSEVDLDPTIDPLFALARRNHDRFPYRDDWLGVTAVGDHGDAVGQATTSLDIGPDEGWSWSTDRAAAFDGVADGFVPIQFDGTLHGPAGAAEPEGVLVAVNGTVAGVGTQITPSGDHSWSFSTIVAEELFQPGANDVEVLLADPNDAGRYIAAAGGRGDSLTVETDSEGLPTSVRARGDVLDVVPTDHRRLEIDAAFTDGRTITVDGWATDTSENRAPEDVVLVVGGRPVSSGVDPYPALAEPTGPLADWGFRLSVPDAAVGGTTRGAVVAVFDGAAVAVPVTWSD